MAEEEKKEINILISYINFQFFYRTRIHNYKVLENLLFFEGNLLPCLKSLVKESQAVQVGGNPRQNSMLLTGE